MIFRKWRNLSGNLIRYLVNDGPGQLINGSYNAYSMLYRGQLSLGLPVSKELIVSQEEIKTRAVQKLALVLYHVFLSATVKPMARDEIKAVIHDELKQGRLRLTENVILLTEDELTHLALKRFKVPPKHLKRVLEIGRRRRILREAVRANPVPIYFENEIEEKEQNGRGDYEIVHYRNFTDQGNAIGFRRIVSLEGVTACDDRPAVVLVPGFANSSNCFNINNRYSLAKDIADGKMWAYLFDSRGVGVNAGRFDPLYTVDTMIDYDLPTLTRFVHKRSHGKPSFLLGHSMGGLVAENMILNWSLARQLDDSDILDQGQKEVLAKSLPTPDAAEEYLNMVRCVISLASPKVFHKNSHIFFPVSLWLNHLSRVFSFQQVPVREVSKLVTELPVLKQINRFAWQHNVGDLNFLIAPENHRDDKRFIERYLKEATESIPLGVGFQCLKAIYNGEGFKRMDGSGLNYSDCLAWFPDNIPLFHFWGTRDNLVPLENMRYRRHYPHKIKKVYHLKSADDLGKINISGERSQLVDFVIEGANHLDLLYGKLADEIVTPLVMQIIETVWGDWTYASALECSRLKISRKQPAKASR
ncbi:MAG: alpha/beta fold hydrolase [Desulfobacterales bacterium]|nr:alpha/beta fold hydrolase [Desulfobacterales bacterium]MDJ0889548.1 alpha/beta fold hydrolase [Desulfobacterales bacterium]MDJ0988568.1 alpha/beta fold hydrolase [Desulfobacterales bacterium]